MPKGAADDPAPLTDAEVREGGKPIGALQRRILDHLHTPEPQAFMTVELAESLLGRTDREAVRQVRRAVDGLATRGLVRTWTGTANPNEDAPPSWWSAEEREQHRASVRTYIRPTRWYWYPCRGEACRYCALGDHPQQMRRWDRDEHEYYVSTGHQGVIIEAHKSRVRWVELSWEARPAAERLALLRRWIPETRKALRKWFPSGEPPEGRGIAGLEHDRWRRLVDQLAEDEARRADAQRSLDGSPSPRRSPPPQGAMLGP